MNEHKFETNPEDRRYSRKWIFAPIITFFGFVTAMIIALVIIGHFTWTNFALSLLAAILASIMSILRLVLKWNSPFKIQYKYHLTISDSLNCKRYKFDRPLFATKGVLDQEPCEEVTLRWKSITSCKISKIRGCLTVKDKHGNKIKIAKNYKDYHIIWPLIIDNL